MPSRLFVIASVVGLSFAFSSGAFAKEEGPCKQIKEACASAGFVKGKAGEGIGLWVDCIEPIVKGTPQPKTATKPLPSVDAKVVAACKEKHPNFGQGKKKEK